MRLLKALAFTAVAVYLAALGALYWFQRDLVFFATTEQTSPEAAGFSGVQVLTLTTPDNEHLVAWYRAPAPNKPLILYYHGNANSLGVDAKRLMALTEGGYGLFAVDYRGYGGSTGHPTEAGLLMDAETAFAKVLTLGTPPDSIILYGHSLGTGVAVATAARHDIAGLILEAPFSSAVDVAQFRYWMFPVRWLMLDPFDSDKHIAKVHAPILMLHGINDQTVPPQFGEKLFELAPEPKEHDVLPAAGHMLLLVPGVADTIHRWIEKNIKSAAPAAKM